MLVLTCDNISKSYSEKPVISGASFGIESTDRVGLVGANGSGKSTLAAIISGVEAPDTGTVTLAGGARVSIMPQHPVFDEQGTALEQVLMNSDPVCELLYRYYQVIKSPAGNEREASELVLRLDRLGGWEKESNAKAILNRLGIVNSQDRISSLSEGGKKRVALARALMDPGNLLILDEPTNHLDIDAIGWLEQYLAKRSGALLVVTHDRWFLDRVTNRIMELDQGNLYQYCGGWAGYLEQKALREDHVQALNRKHLAILKRELDWLRQGAKARSTKEKIRKERYKELAARELPREAERLALDLPSQRLGKKVIEVKGVSKSWTGQPLIRDFSHIFLPGDRIGIIGPNGSGKSTLLQMLAGRVAPDSGSVQFGPTVKVGVYDQQPVELVESMRVLEFVESIRFSVSSTEGTISASKMLERFLFDQDKQWASISQLSGGERRRLCLLAMLLEQPNVLLLDEPTNDLDITTLMVLEEFLDDFAGTAVIVSHDRMFLEKTVEHMLCLDGRGNVLLHTGSFNDTPGIWGQRESREVRGDSRSPRAKSKLSYKEQQELEELVNNTARLEQRLKQIQTEINACGGDHLQLAKLHSQHQQAEAELESSLERWLVLQQTQEDYEQNK